MSQAWVADELEEDLPEAAAKDENLGNYEGEAERPDPGDPLYRPPLLATDRGQAGRAGATA